MDRFFINTGRSKLKPGFINHERPVVKDENDDGEISGAKGVDKAWGRAYCRRRLRIFMEPL